MHGWKRWAVVAVAVVVVLVVGGPFIYFHLIEGPARKPLTVDNATVPTVSGAATTALRSLDGTWKAENGSKAGYRVKETLFGQSNTAVGDTNAVTGSMTLSGTTIRSASFTVDMTKISSDKGLRDSQFEGRIMDTGDFPSSTFTLTKAIDFGSVPAVGTKITPSATGTLTLHGTTKTVTIPLTAKRAGNAIVVAGSTTITFSDYGIDNPSGGPASVGNEGTMEFQLVLVRA